MKGDEEMKEIYWKEVNILKSEIQFLNGKIDEYEAELITANKNADKLGRLYNEGVIDEEGNLNRNQDDMK